MKGLPKMQPKSMTPDTNGDIASPKHFSGGILLSGSPGIQGKSPIKGFPVAHHLGGVPSHFSSKPATYHTMLKRISKIV